MNANHASSLPVVQYKSLSEILAAHKLAKDAPKRTDTHLENGEYKNKFRIPPEMENQFEDLYYRDAIKSNRPNYILEHQFMRDGDTVPGTIAVDLDFKYASDSLERRYTRDAHIVPFLQRLMMEIHRLYSLDADDTTIRAFILEKPSPRLKDPGTVSDGVHMIVGLSVPMLHHMWLRDKMVAWVDQHWCTPTDKEGAPVPTFLDTANSAESIVDKALMAGNTAWLKYNSRKEGDIMVYKATAAYEYGLDDGNEWNPAQGCEVSADGCKFGPWIQTDISPPVSPAGESQWLKKYYRELSLRNRNVPTGVTRESMDAELGDYRASKDRSRRGAVSEGGTNITGGGDDGIPCIDPSVLRCINDDAGIADCVQLFFDNLSPDDSTTREMWEYTMSLPVEYYGKGSYQKRLNVGFALHDYSPKMLVTYIAFCAQRESFDYSRVPDICDKWASFTPRPDGVKHVSIMWWSMTSAPDKWRDIRENTVDYLIDQTLETVTINDVNNPRKKNANGCSDCDKADILYRLARGRFKCASIRGNVWFHFRNHHWTEDDQGTTLRAMISNELRALYRKKVRSIMLQLSESTDVESDHYKIMLLRANKVLDIVTSLGNRSTKDNILHEARERFYDPKFLEMLNTNMYLTCFENGVLDAKTKTFRPGYPEDYISKCTRTNYVPLSEQPPEAIERTYNYLRQVFPEPDTMEYAIDHLASLWVGDSSKNQCLHFYEGFGQNGKSRFVRLITMMLGTYAVYIDVGFYTQDRGRMGDATPELWAIIAARYIYSSEPNEGARLVEGPMKQVTGGTDDIAARAPYGQLVTFLPQANAAIQCNNLPVVVTTDHGTWRRLRRLIFLSLFTRTPVKGDPNRPYQFPLMEPDQMKTLFEEMKTVLASITIDRMFKTEGLVKLCPAVEVASNEYKEDQDVVAAFIGDKLEAKAGGVVRVVELNKEFADWCIEVHGNKELARKKQKDLHTRLDGMYGINGKKVGWKGVAIKYDIPAYELGAVELEDDEHSIDEHTTL